MSERNLAGFTKFLLDVGYILALCALPALPFLLRWAAPQYPSVAEHRVFHLILFFLGDLGCIFIIRELRRMFRTVLEDRCFVRENVTSLRRMGYYGLGIALVMAVRLAVAFTPATVFIIAVFFLAALFSFVLAGVFHRAVRYKEENDLTI